jgi:branched-chain amino acid transport system permease protein
MRRAAPAVLGALVLLAPLALFTNYHLFQLTLTIAYAIAILGLNLVTGYNGQVSLGHGAFYAIGAYTTAILMNNYGVPYWATIPVAALICAGFGFAVGLPALRLGGLYLALVTFALAVAVPQVLKVNALGPWTGGAQGIVLDKPDAPFGLPLSSDQWLYLFALAIATVLFVLARNLVHGRIGRAMMAVRDHPLAAEAMGVPIAMLKTRTFAVSALYTGIAGSIGAIAVAFVAPDSFQVFLSIFLFVGLVVGGVGSLAGPVFGALFVQFIPNLAQDVSKAAPDAVYGVILIAFLYLMPGGVAGAWRRGVAALTKQRAVPLPDQARGALAAGAPEPATSKGGNAHAG